jgi:hypothetical protein
MSVLNDTWRFLVQRRLWPVAILLIAAAAAVPMLLASTPPAPAPAPPVAVKADKDSVLAEEPIVTAAADGDRSGRRHVLGSPKDPFKPQATPTPTPTPQAATQVTTTTSTGASTGSTTTTSGGSAPTTGASPAPVSGAPVLPSPKKKTYELYELTVRFGASDGSRPPRKDVKRLQALPSNDEPVLIYLGVLDDKKTAVFMLDSGVVAQGDGTCRPSRTTCETIHVREGETEFFDVPSDTSTGTTTTGDTSGQQYELDVLKIRKTTTTDAKKARKAMARVSTKGRMILRARVAGDGPLRYRYDKKTGRLEKLSKKAYKAVVAKAARMARAHF